jgi:hypothetical protein
MKIIRDVIPVVFASNIYTSDTVVWSVFRAKKTYLDRRKVQV